MARDEYSYLDHMVPVSAREVIFQSPQAIRYNTHENQPQATLDGADEMALANAGKRGDDRIAHINASEEKLLEAVSGNKSRNPETGLRQFYNVAGGSIAAGEREGYSGGGTGGTAGAHHEAGRNQPGHGVNFGSEAEKKAFADKYYGKPEIGEVIGGVATGIVSAVADMFTGGLVGVVRDVAGLEGNPFGRTPTDRMDAALAGPANIGGSNMGSGGQAPSGQGGGAGNAGQIPKPKTKPAAANPPASGNGTGQTPTTPTPNPAGPLDPQTQSLVEILLGRFETPLFSKTLSPYELDNAKHDAMKAQAMNTILNGDALNGVG